MECAHNTLKYFDSQLVGYNPEKLHVQVFVDEVNAFVDSRVSMNVKYLNRIGIKTSSSCEEIHDDEWGPVIHLNLPPALKDKFVNLMEQTSGLEYKVSTEEGIALFYFTKSHSTLPEPKRNLQIFNSTICFINPPFFC